MMGKTTYLINTKKMVAGESITTTFPTFSLRSLQINFVDQQDCHNNRTLPVVVASGSASI
jgi:hypothetical protein